MIDAIVEVLWRLLLYAVVEIVFGLLFYWPGWVMLRILTLGRYPPRKAEPHNRGAVAFFAFCVVLVAVLFYIEHSTK